jgi:hypothetical protein
VPMAGDQLRLSGPVDQVQAGEQDQAAAHPFGNDSTFGFLVPVEIALGQPSAGAGQDDDGAVTGAMGEKQDDPVQQGGRGHGVRCFARLL